MRLRALVTAAGIALAFGLALPRTTLAGASASVFSRSGNGQSSSDFDSVGSGLASATVSGGQGGHLFSTIAFASGDSGRIGAATSDTLIGVDDLAFSLAEGQVFDTLTFLGSGSTTVELTFTMLGSFRNTGGPSGFSSIMQLRVVNRIDLTASAFWSDTSPGALVGYGASLPPDGSEIILPTQPLDRLPENVHATIIERFTVAAGDSVDIVGRLRVNASPATDSTSNGEFDHTAQLALSLPEGWSFTSASGSFLSVPEPSGMVLVVVGSMCLLGRRGGRRRLAVK